MSKKVTINYIKKYISNFEYKCITNIYINSHSKLLIKCNKGHLYFVEWNKFQQGRRCPKCSGWNKTIQEVQDIFLRDGYKILNQYYINIQHKMIVKCPNGHIFKTSFDNFVNRGRRCSECYRDRMKDRFGSKNPNWKNYDIIDLDLITKYKKKVIQKTYSIYRKNKNLINKNNLKHKRGHYSLDHIYSIMGGFKNNIPPEIISSINNLRMLPESENISKRDRSDITRHLLYHIAY